MEQGTKRLYRSRTDRMISGVCGGLAEYFDLDPTVVRVLALAAAAVTSGGVVLAYLVMTVVVPEQPEEAVGATGDAAPATPQVGEKGGQNGGAEQHPEGAPTATAAPPAPPSGSAPAATSAAGPPPHHRRGGGLTLGVLLIGVGLLLLADRFLEGVNIWALWPVIIVALGIKQMVTRGDEPRWTPYRVFDGISTVVFGVLLLGNTTGVLPWSVWWDLISLWPLLLVVIGIELVGKAMDQTWIRIFGKILSIAVLVYVGAVAYGTGGGTQAWGFAWGDMQSFSYEETARSTREARLDLNAGSGVIDVRGGAEGLITAEGETPYGDPLFTVDRSGSEADVELTLGEGAYVLVPGARGTSADIALSEDVAWDIRLESGASRLNADLSDVQLTGLDIRTGVTDAVVTLGNQSVEGDSRVPIEVRAGVSSVTLRIPKSTAGSVRVSSGITTVNHDNWVVRTSGGGPVGGGEYTVNAHLSSMPVWDIRVESGVGTVRIETY